MAATVSVVIPTHNTRRYIAAALESVFNQTYKDFEIIVVDDASSDGTEDALEPYFDRIVYVKQAHAGSAVARNRGLLRSSGEYVAFLDADDLWLPSKLEKQVDLAERHPEAVLVYSDFNRTESVGESLDSGLAKRTERKVGEEFTSLLRQNFLHTSSVLIRRNALADSGVFDPKLINAQDWDLWVRLADIGPFVLVDEILTHYRLHETQSVKTSKYVRNVVFADELMRARLSRREDALPHIERKLAEDLWYLGRREWKSGNFREARNAYWRCARLPARRAQAIGRALVCSLPAPILRPIARSST